MKNKFILLDKENKKYDIIIIIPTIPKKENKKRVDKIINLIKKAPPKNLSWTIYLAYEGKDWNEAINIAFNRLKHKVRKGFILLDDDAFPTSEWMDGFEKYLERLPNSILQWAMIDKNGVIRWKTKIFKLDRVSKAILSLLFNFPFIKEYLPNSTKVSKNARLEGAMKVHAVCFSCVFIPIKIINEVGQLKDRMEDENIVYGEDYDFCYRALQKGFYSYKIPRKVFHNLATTKSKKNLKDKELYSDLWLYYRWFTNKEFLNKLKNEKLIEDKFVFFKLLKNELNHLFLKIISNKQDFKIYTS